MKLPKWIPKAPKPWNPAFRDTWEAMGDDEKRMSFLIDIIVCVAFMAILLVQL